jgi:hypothetical protein
MVAGIPFPGQHSFSTHEALGRRMLFGLTKKGAKELTMADRRPIVAKYLATNRKPNNLTITFQLPASEKSLVGVKPDGGPARRSMDVFQHPLVYALPAAWLA